MARQRTPGRPSTTPCPPCSNHTTTQTMDIHERHLPGSIDRPCRTNRNLSKPSGQLGLNRSIPTKDPSDHTAGHEAAAVRVASRNSSTRLLDVNRTGVRVVFSRVYTPISCIDTLHRIGRSRSAVTIDFATLRLHFRRFATCNSLDFESCQRSSCSL